jgi:hypothetical protein
MSLLSEQEKAMMEQIELRLRQVHSDLASAESNVRAQALCDTVRECLADKIPSDQKRYAEYLLRRFPVAGNVAASIPAAPPKPAETPEELAQRLLEVLEQIPHDRRAALTQTLLSSPHLRSHKAPSSGSGQSAGLLDEVRKQLKLPPQQEVDLARVPVLLARLTALLHEVDERLVDIRFAGRRVAADFMASSGEFLKGNEAPLKTHEKETRRLAFGIRTAMRYGGSTLANKLLARFAPEQIENVIQTEAGAWAIFGNPKEKCWDKYKELASSLGTPNLIERAFLDCMKEIIDNPLPAAAHNE